MSKNAKKERMNNSALNITEFHYIGNESGGNDFVLSTKHVNRRNIGILNWADLMECEDE